MGVTLEVDDQIHVLKTEFLFHPSIKLYLRVEIENLPNLLRVYYVPCSGFSKMVETSIAFILERGKNNNNNKKSEANNISSIKKKNKIE